MQSAIAVVRTEPTESAPARPCFLRLHEAEPADRPEWTPPVAGIEAPQIALPQIDFPEFRPHALLRGGHAQTISGLFFPGDVRLPRVEVHPVALPDGDAVVLHDEVPAGWKVGGPTAVLVHGLTGCAGSSYMVRTARKLCERGVRCFRMDMRSTGAAWGLSRKPYHAGCSTDILAALHFVNRLCGDGPAHVVGFSLGGNIILKLLGECPESIPSNVARAVAVNPSVDLDVCSKGLERPINRIYSQHFLRAMCRHLAAARDLVERHRIVALSRTVRVLREFDDLYTAPVHGYGCADEYYSACSAGQFVPAIRVPTLILAAQDDPLIPAELFHRLSRSPATAVHLAPSGGHLGFIGRSGVDADRRWMDWRIVDWITARESERPAPALA